jgi:hypothetical protein
MAAGAVVGVLLLVYGTVGLPATAMSGSEAEITTAGMWATDSANGQVGASWTGEFLPNTVTEQRWAIGRAPSGETGGETGAGEPAPVEMRVRPLRVGYLEAEYAVAAPAGGTLAFHQFYFPPWAVTIDGVQAAARALGDLGLLAVEAPPGEHVVRVRWEATGAVWAGRALTVLGWLLVLGLVLAWTGGWTRALGAGAWVVVGVLFLVGASGVTARAVEPRAVGADFGSVRLEAAEVPPARAGAHALLRLYWTVEGPVEPLTAFVHVVDGSGALVAQFDGPLGGAYTPVERWRPGLVMGTTFAVPLPPELAPGRYEVMAGVYRPGAADAPIVPVRPDGSAGAARVEIGVLEVAP